jgi:hypothetical protein
MVQVKLRRRKSYIPTLQIPVSLWPYGDVTSQSDPHDPKAIQQHEEGSQSYGVPPRRWNRNQIQRIVTSKILDILDFVDLNV